MALSNRERIGRILKALKDGLGPFILREYRTAYTEKGYVSNNWAHQGAFTNDEAHRITDIAARLLNNLVGEASRMGSIVETTLENIRESELGKRGSELTNAVTVRA